MKTIFTLGQQVAAISRWIDASPSYRDVSGEALLWRRTMKMASEVGEVQEAIDGMLGANPRKGVTHTMEDVIEECLDVALAALGAVEHMTGNWGRSGELLTTKAEKVMIRAGLSL